MELRVLTLQHYSENIEDERRITLSVEKINLVAAHTDDVSVRGISIRNLSVLFEDGGAIDLALNHQDLETLERAVGAYYLSDN